MDPYKTHNFHVMFAATDHKTRGFGIKDTIEELHEIGMHEQYDFLMI